MKIDPSECVLVCRIRDEEQNLVEFLKHHDPFFDKMIAVADRCTDRSLEILRASSKCDLIIERIRGHYSQDTDWAILKEAANQNHHRWMIFVDIDERLPLRFLEEDFPESTVQIGFKSLSLFPDSNHFITGNHRYADLSFKRKIHRRLQNYGFSLYHHVRGAKTIEFPMFNSRFVMLHSHMLDPDRRRKRYELYMSYDPESTTKKRTYSEKHESYKHIIEIEDIKYHPLQINGQKLETTDQLSDIIK